MKNAVIAFLLILMCSICNSEIFTLAVLLIGAIAFLVSIFKESEAHNGWQ